MLGSLLNMEESVATLDPLWILEIGPAPTKYVQTVAHKQEKNSILISYKIGCYMGVNVVALIPYKGINIETKKGLELIENKKDGSFMNFYTVLKKNDFSASDWKKAYWYDEKERQIIANPILNEPLRYSLIHGCNLYFKFGINTIEVISWIRMNSFIQNIEIQEAMLECYCEIGNNFDAMDFYILGDNHPLYFSHIESKGKFRELSQLAKRLEIEKKSEISDMYVDLDDSYDIEGFYKYNLISKKKN